MLPLQTFLFLRFRLLRVLVDEFKQYVTLLMGTGIDAHVILCIYYVFTVLSNMFSFVKYKIRLTFVKRT